MRGFTQDDDEINFTLDFCLSMLRAFGVDDFSACLSTRPQKYVEDWEQAESVLQAAWLRTQEDLSGMPIAELIDRI